MLHKCANTACDKPFRSLSHGKLFLVENDQASAEIAATTQTTRRGRAVRRMERYWLCDACCSHLTLIFERGRGVTTIPLPASKSLGRALHLTQPGRKEYRELKGVS